MLRSFLLNDAADVGAIQCYRAAALTPVRNAAWAEAIQLVPILSLAFPFIVAGKVDLARAGSGFLIGSLLAIPILIVLWKRRLLLNPILVGTDLWLGVGALAFSVPIDGIVAWLIATQSFGLFVAVLALGVLTTWFSPHGYVACTSNDQPWLRRASLGLLGLTVLVVGWAWLFRHDIRLGGGLPFIVLNVARRVIGRRAPRNVQLAA